MAFLNRWVPVILWMGGIYAISANSDPFRIVPQIVTVPNEIIGRLAHVFEFAVLAVLVGRAVLEGEDIRSRAATPIFLFSVSYGVFDELHQSWIPERAFQVFDLGLDILGIMIGLGLILLYKTRV